MHISINLSMSACGFLLWLLVLTCMLLFSQVGRQYPTCPAMLGAAIRKLATKKLKNLFFGCKAPTPQSGPEPAAAPA